VTCTFTTMPSMKSPADVSKCFKDAMAELKPTSSKEGVDEFDFGLEAKQTGIEIKQDNKVSVTTDHLIKEMVLHSEVTIDALKKIMISDTTVTPTNAVAETPDPALFIQPADWPTCTKIDAPPAGALANNPTVAAFMKCAGLMDEAVMIV